MIVFGVTFSNNAFAEDLELNLLNSFDLVSPNGSPHAAIDIHVDDSGLLYTVQHFIGIQVFDSEKNLTLYIDGKNSEIDPLSGLNGITADSDGNIYLAESRSTRTLVFNSDGDFVTNITAPTIQHPLDVEVSFDGIVYVADTNAIFSFDENYNFISSFGIQSWINVDDNGNIQTLSVFDDIVTVYDKNGIVLQTIVLEPVPGGAFSIFGKFTSDSAGNFFFVGTGNIDGKFMPCVFMYDQSGSYLAQFCENTEDQFGSYAFTSLRDISIPDNGIISVSADVNLHEFTFEDVYCGELGTSYENIIFGTENDDTLTGTKNSDVLVGLGGNDLLKGKKGDDCLLGGAGSDDIRGGAGHDLIDAGADDDIVKGGNNDDVIFGGAGHDIISGGKGNDMLSGNAGNDEISGQAGDDKIFGNEGDDFLKGNKGDDIIEGNQGNDIVNGGNNDDILFGGLGDDELLGKKGNDACEFGPGEDIEVCESIIPLETDLFLELDNDEEVTIPGDELELEFEAFLNSNNVLIDNVQISAVYDNSLQFNSDRTMEEINTDLEGIDFVVTDLGDGTSQLDINAFNSASMDGLAMIVVFDVPISEPASTSTIFVKTTISHPSFVDLDLSNNSGSMDVTIFVP